AQPGPEALAEAGQHLLLLVQQGALGDDLAVGGAARGGLYLPYAQAGAGAADQPLDQAADARAALAGALDAPACRLDLRLEAPVVEGAVVARAPLRRHRPAGAPGEPAEAQRRPLRLQRGHPLLELARLDRPLDGDRPRHPLQLQDDAAREAARVEHQVA